ncbi:MAG: helix-turn-helix transcriptional regulator, partial [Pseudomonadota bacterium]|nr:helix-turn-helix transcriptional regulator [Pseudomonadota bacterium]
ASTLDIIGDRWSLVIIRSMVVGAKSYSDFLAMPERIATNILAERLRRLEASGLIVETQPRQGSQRGSYALTAKGAGLIPVLQALARWGENNIADRWTPPERFYAARAADYAEGGTAKVTEVPGKA